VKEEYAIFDTSRSTDETEYTIQKYIIRCEHNNLLYTAGNAKIRQQQQHQSTLDEQGWPLGALPSSPLAGVPTA
jgi:hypothetical protein